MTEKVWTAIICFCIIVVLGFIYYGDIKRQEYRHAYYTVCTARGGTVIEASNGFFHCIADKLIIRIGEVK